MALSARRALRWLVPLTLLALVLAACEVDDDVDEEIEEDPEEEVDDPDPDPDDEEDEDVAEEPVDVEPFTYEMGMFDDVQNDTYWAYLEDADVWSAYVVSGTPCQLYTLEPPTYTPVPGIATHDWDGVLEEDGDVWVAEVEIQDWVEWSDGEPVTAHDMEFTWNTVVEYPLGGQWISSYEPEPLDAGPTTNIEAVDDTTVRIEFAERPGLGTWPMQVALAPIMPEHHWAPIVEEHDDVESFLAESGQGSPVCGPFEFTEWEEGAFAAKDVNENYYREGASFTHYEDGTVEIVSDELGFDDMFGGTGEGDVLAEYTVGPYADELIFTIFGEASVAVASLVDGEFPFLLTGPGVEEAAQDEMIDAEDVEVVINPDYGMQYLGFNFNREPMDDVAFREAVATVIDREYITDTVMGGSALPLYTHIPSGNEAWWNPDVGDQIVEDWQFEHMAERVDAAVEILADAGYTWDTEPETDEETGEVVEHGEGLTMPDGNPVPDLELSHPTAGYDPLRNTAGLHIAEFMNQVGIPVESNAMEFGALVEASSDPENLEYDMHILGWSLGNPALPTYFHAFWFSESPVNNTGYANEEFDEAVNAFMGAESLDEAYDILWEDLQPMLDEDLPYVTLFDTPSVEGYRHEEITFPYTEVLSGIENVDGMPHLVTQE